MYGSMCVAGIIGSGYGFYVSYMMALSNPKMPAEAVVGMTFYYGYVSFFYPIMVPFRLLCRVVNKKLAHTTSVTAQ